MCQVEWNLDSFGIAVGVPQGSIIGPGFFILNVNDYPDCLQYSSANKYADYNTLDVSD